jgi:hypothetical protein
VALLVPDIGEVFLLQYLLNIPLITNGDKVLHLYNNDVTPAESMTMGTLTEATEAGYTPHTMTSATWTVATAGGTTTGSYTQRTFTFTTGATIYGYYVTDAANSTYLWCERFAGAPFTLPAGGGTIAVTPRIELE